MKSAVSDFLRNISDTENKFLSVADAKKRSLKGISDKEIQVILTFLNLFNVVEYSEDKRSIRPVSEIAGNFIKSLAAYIDNNLNLFADWSKKGQEEHSLESLLQHGAHFLYQMEERRVNKLSNREPLAHRHSVLLIIKGKVQGSVEDHFLYQFNNESLIYKTIGGNKLPSESNEATIKRVLARELPLQELILGENYEIKPVYEGFETFKISIKNATYTKYTIDFYYVHFSLPVLKLSKLDRWISIEEMKDEQTYDGIGLLPLSQHIPAKVEFENIINSLPGSLDEIQPYKRKSLTKKNEKKEVSRIERVIKSEESVNLEFKSSMRWDYKLCTTNKILEKVIVKSITGFLNTEGGTLVIGLDDNKNILGVEKDWDTLPKKNADGYMNYIMSLVTSGLGTEFSQFVKIDFDEANKKNVCFIDIKKSPQPVFLKEGNAREFYIRAGNSTRPLNSEEVYKYIQIHW